MIKDCKISQSRNGSSAIGWALILIGILLFFVGLAEGNVGIIFFSFIFDIAGVIANYASSSSTDSSSSSPSSTGSSGSSDTSDSSSGPTTSHGSEIGSQEKSDKRTTLDRDFQKETRADVGLNAKLVLPTGETMPISRGNQWFGREEFVGIISREKLEYLSRDHFNIIKEGGKYYIEDRDSTNGTTLNGVNITGMGKRELHDGDKIYLADRITLTFRG